MFLSQFHLRNRANEEGDREREKEKRRNGENKIDHENEKKLDKRVITRMKATHVHVIKCTVTVVPRQYKFN